MIILNKKNGYQVRALISSTRIAIRNISQADIPRIVELQRKIYPEVASGQIYAPFFIEKHLRVFPDGQFCAELEGKIVGSATSLVVNLKPQYKRHRWTDIVGYGNRTAHDKYGDSLYADDIVIDPLHRYQGIGSALLEARKKLCMRLGLRRMIGGGRIYNYCLFKDKMSPHQYAMSVVNNHLVDPVLTFQLKNQFKYIKILPNYLVDHRSLNFATLIEWNAPKLF